jgi:uncharacterized protein (TIGR02266 family)
MPDSGASKTIVVADDTAFVRDRFKAAIEGAGHRAVTVATAAGLMSRMQKNAEQIDLVVLDLQLPNTSGLHIVRQIRRMNENVPILVFSGTVSSAEQVRELAALGVSGYVNEYSGVHNILPSLAPHLFPESHNRRSSPRMIFGVPITCRVGNTITAALTLNLSRGGLAIRSASPLDKDSKVHLRFRLPGGKKDIEADAVVRWTDRMIGMGLQFERISAEDQQSINELVDAHFFQRRKA